MTIDEVENLIKKHEAFEKSASAQEERFLALERLTTVSIQLKQWLLKSVVTVRFKVNNCIAFLGMCE